MTFKLTEVLKKRDALRDEANRATVEAADAVQRAEKLQKAADQVEAELAGAEVVFPGDVSDLFDNAAPPPPPKASKAKPEATVVKAAPAPKPAVKAAPKAAPKSTKNSKKKTTKASKKAAKSGTAPKKQTVKAKTKKVAAKTKKTKSFTAEGKKNAAQGREDVQNGKRPPLRLALIKIMGKKAMRAAELVEKLTEKKWLPNSSNPRQYVSYVLSDNTPSTFERTGVRGQYRVTANVLKKASAVDTTTVKTEPKADVAAKNDKLREYGIDVPDGAKPDVAPNPFSNMEPTPSS